MPEGTPETREWVVIKDAAVTVGEKVFRRDEVANIKEFGSSVDWLFEQQSVRWADAGEVEKHLAAVKSASGSETKTSGKGTK